jgi:hypothetical protein
MASRFMAASIPDKRRFTIDRIVLAAALAFAVLSVLVTWRTFATDLPDPAGVSRLEAARPVTGIAQASR